MVNGLNLSDTHFEKYCLFNKSVLLISYHFFCISQTLDKVSVIRNCLSFNSSAVKSSCGEGQCCTGLFHKAVYVINPY